MTSIRTRAALALAAASMAGGFAAFAAAPIASANVHDFNVCIAGANPEGWKGCCILAGGTVKDDDCWFNGNALSPESQQGPTRPTKPVVIVKQAPAQAQARL